MIAQIIQKATAAVRVGTPVWDKSKIPDIHHYQSDFDKLQFDCLQAMYDVAKKESGSDDYNVISLTINHDVNFGLDKSIILIVGGSLVYSYEKEE